VTETPTTLGEAGRPPPPRHGPGAGPIALGAVVAGLTLVVYQWVLLAVGIPLRMFFPLAALFVAQAVFNGVVLACCFGELEQTAAASGAARRQVALRQVGVVLVGALFALSGVLPLAFAKLTGAKVSEPAAILGIGGLLAAAVLVFVVAPVLYGLAVRRGSGLRKWP